MLKSSLLFSYVLMALAPAVCWGQTGRGKAAAAKAPRLTDEQRVDDAITFRVLLVDVALNLSGNGDVQRLYRDKIRERIGQISSRYGFKGESIKAGKLGVSNVGGSGPPFVGDIRVPDVWTDIFEIENAGTLPQVLCRRGIIKLFYESLSITAEDGCECRLDKNVFIYSNGRWTLVGPR
jgi:hypothetical protein